MYLTGSSGNGYRGHLQTMWTAKGEGGYLSMFVHMGGGWIWASVHVDYDSHIFTFDIRYLQVMYELDIPQITCSMFGFLKFQ